MNIRNKVIKNTGVILLANSISTLTSVVLSVLYARYLGDVRFGKFGFATSFTAMFYVFSDLNLNTLAIRDNARNRSNLSLYISNVLTIRALFSLAMLLAIVGSVLFLKLDPDLRFITVIIASSSLLSSMGSSIRWWFQAVLKMEYEAFSSIAGSIFLLLGSLLVLYRKGGLIALGWISFGASASSLMVVSYLTYTNFGLLAFRMNSALIKNILKESVPFALVLVFSTIYVNIDKVMLFSWKGAAVAGWYSVGYRFLLVAKLIPAAFAASLLPLFSEYHATSREKFINTIAESLRYMFIIGFPMAVGTTLLSKQIITVIFGLGFLNSAPVLQILIWAAFMIFFSLTIGQSFLGAGKQKLNAIVCGLGLLLNVVLNLILIPRFAHVGASISILATEAFVTAFTLLWATKNHLLALTAVKPLMKPMFAGSIMAGFIYYIDRFSLNLWILAPLGVVIYGGCLLITGAFNRERKRWRLNT